MSFAPYSITPTYYDHALPKPKPKPPAYRTDTDASLNQVSEENKEKKQLLIKRLTVAKESYIPKASLKATSYDVLYYFYDLLLQQFSSHKANQCERLIEMTKAIGSKKFSATKFLYEEYKDLYKLFNTEENRELMKLLVEVYQLDKEYTRFLASYRGHMTFMDQQITFFRRPFLNNIFPNVIADLILEYSSEAPIEEKTEPTRPAVTRPT